MLFVEFLMRKIIVVKNPSTWKLESGDIEVISSKTYLEHPQFGKTKDLRVFNLSNDYDYQTRGYYVSLLAEARGHKVMPSVKNILDIKGNTVVKVISDELEELIQKSFRTIKSKEFELSVYFGRNIAIKYNKLSLELHKIFQVPLFRAKFVLGKKWELKSIKTIAMNQIPDYHLEFLNESASDFFSKKRYNVAHPETYLYDLAILVNPKEKAPPSDAEALKKFVDAAERKGCYVDFITKDDYNRIGEYDALFIRETTAVNHHTYRFARRAQAEGLSVIDSPEAILKCANKVYLAEVLALGKINTPKTHILTSPNVKGIEHKIGFPCVLKLPDSAFSQGVVKAHNLNELKAHVKSMMKQSDLVLVQEYTPTDFDWRIGVLNSEVIFACKYFMAKDHWQIYNWKSEDSADISGAFTNVPIGEVPSFIIDAALKSTKLIGKGLFGVDVKEINGKPLVIEVNDNPNIDSGIEDLLLGTKLYDVIIGQLISQINRNEKNLTL